MRSDPPWATIRDAVRARIRGRDYAPGALIPTEAALAAEFGVARATVSRALGALAAEGLLDRRRKAGSRVVPEPPRRATLEIPRIRRQIEATGAAYAARLLRRAEEGLPPPLATALGGPTWAWRIVTAHHGDGRLRVHEDRWVNPHTAPGIANADLQAQNANEWLLEHVPYDDGRLTIEAVSAGPLAAAFGCAEGAAVLRLTRVTRAAGVWITHVVQTHAPGHSLDSAL